MTTGKYNDLNRELENVQLLPRPPLVFHRTEQLEDFGRRVKAAFQAFGVTAEDVICAVRSAGISFLNLLREIEPTPAPPTRRKAHGRLRSQRELRDIRRQRGL